MGEANGTRRTEPTEDCVVSVTAENHVCTATFYLEPGEGLRIVDDDPNIVAINAIEDTDANDKA